MLAREPTERSEGTTTEGTAACVKACIEPFLTRAKEEGVPVWLETASESSKRDYENLGFRVCEEVVIGKGRVNAKGWPDKDGEGVKTWAMIWDGHLN